MNDNTELPPFPDDRRPQDTFVISEFTHGPNCYGCTALIPQGIAAAMDLMNPDTVTFFTQSEEPKIRHDYAASNAYEPRHGVAVSRVPGQVVGVRIDNVPRMHEIDREHDEETAARLHDNEVSGRVYAAIFEQSAWAEETKRNVLATRLYLEARCDCTTKTIHPDCALHGNNPHIVT